MNHVQGVYYVAFAKTAWTTKTCWNHKPNPGPWTHYTGKCRKTEPTKSWDFPCHIDDSSHHMVQLDRQNLKDPIICPPKTEDMHLTPNSFLASKQKRGGKSRGATRGLNKHLSTLHSRSIALNLSLPSIKQKRDQNKKSNVLLVAYTSVTQWIFGHFLGVTVKYTSIYNDCCWAHLGTFVSFMFWSSSPPVPGELAPQLWEQLLRTTWVKFNRGFVWPKQVKQTFPRACMGLAYIYIYMAYIYIYIYIYLHLP